jgi:hypothetical protein
VIINGKRLKTEDFNEHDRTKVAITSKLDNNIYCYRYVDKDENRAYEVALFTNYNSCIRIEMDNRVIFDSSNKDKMEIWNMIVTDKDRYEITEGVLYIHSSIKSDSLDKKAKLYYTNKLPKTTLKVTLSKLNCEKISINIWEDRDETC